jgi:hypothetical protein
MSTEENTPEPGGDDKIALTVEIDPREFFEQAVGLAVHKLLHESRAYNEDGDHGDFANAFYREVRAQISDALKAGVVDKAKEVAERVLAEPLPKVDTYGQVVAGGPTETLTEKVAAEIKLQIMDRAGNYDGYGSRKTDSVLHTIVHKEVQKVIEADLKGELAEARKQVKAAVAGKVTALLEAETLRAAGIQP